MKEKTKSGNKESLILIAEDSPTQAERLKYILEENNFKVKVAKNGKEALVLIHEELPSLVISDIIMPEMDGYELCQKIKANENTMDIPVILLTSLSSSEDVLEGLAYGADNFLTKPYNEDYLLSHIENILLNKKLGKTDRVRVGVEIVLGGKKRFITAGQQQMLTLLISTYEAAVSKNEELLKTQSELTSLNEHLEELVNIRTAELSEEVSIRKLTEDRVVKLNRIYASLSNINQTIVRVHDKNQLLNDASRIAIDDGKFQSSWIGIINNETNKIETSVCAGIENNLIEVSPEQNPILKSIQIKEQFFSNDIASDNRLTDIWKENSLTLGFKSFGVFPLVVQAKVIGGFCLYSNEINFFDDQEINLLDEIATDISFALENIQREFEKKKVEELLQKLNKAIRNAREVIFMTDKEGIITFVNPEFTKMYGYKAEEVVGKVTPRILKSGMIEKEVYEQFWKALLEKKSLSAQYINKTKDGKLIDVEGSTDPILDDNGEIIGFLGIQKDNTERKKYEEGLKEAKEQAEELSRLKSSFLANMSHELRTPMIGILGFSELLIDEKDINTVNDYANMINESGKRLMSTLNSILDLSRIESGELKLNLKYLDVCEVMNNLVDLYSVSAKNKNLNLSFNSPIQSIMLSTDSQALTSIFGNIISNAVKYTEKGSIEISMEKEIINDKDWLVTIVSDTGIGIDSSNIDIIFKEFRQVSEGIDRNFEGSGLGLTITKKYVDLLGGTITVDSKIGKGTTFIIKLPIGTELMETSDKLSRESISNLQNINTSRKNIRAKMLYVEDDSISAILVNTIVRNIIDVEIAINATDAIEKAKANSYDIILMDINLGSGKDGLYATKEIRKLKSYSNIPIIAVTAFAMVGDKEDFLSKGCDYYISKPYNGENLINSIKQALNS